MTLRVALLGLILAAALASTVAAAECTLPETRDDGWQIATPESVGIDRSILCPLAARFEEWKEANIHGVLVIRRGKLVYERYFTGFDQLHATGPATVAFGARTKHDLRSMTKSFTALVTGAAVGRGWLDIEKPVLSFFPDYADLRSPEKDQIKVRHLLMMAAGLEWNDDPPFTNEIALNRSADPYRYFLSLPVVQPPGTVFNYSGGATATIGAVLKQATGKTFEALARELLLEPLGISDVAWTRTGNGDVRDWCCFHLRPRDIAKLGQLVLQRGEWHGVQVVPAAWIETSTSAQITANTPFRYGYQFWIYKQGAVDVVAALGQGGQRLFVVPALDLVVVTTAGHYYGQGELSARVPRTVFNDYVLPAVDARR
jgi:CubicO group peptidase (beta-lactamase class C family)